MRLPPALAPLRHPTFRMLWIANVVTSVGTWFQNTGAGWLMTTLSPDPLTVSLVQAATILPMCLPSFAETGKIYDYRAGRLNSFRAPA